MIDGLFNQTNYVAAKKMLDATALRHEAIASNLANLETPRYKRVSSKQSPPRTRAVSPACSRNWPWILPLFLSARTATPCSSRPNC